MMGLVLSISASADENQSLSESIDQSIRMRDIDSTAHVGAAFADNSGRAKSIAVSGDAKRNSRCTTNQRPL